MSRFKKWNWFEKKIIKHQGYRALKSKYFKEFMIYYKNPYELLHTYDEIFVKEIYSFCSTTDNPLIIDCGSNIGLSIIYFKLMFPKAIVIGFEPDTENFEILKKNIIKNELHNVIIENKALWIYDGRVGFEENGTEASRVVDSGHAKKVDCARLKSLLQSYASIDFIKMDIEGSEFEVLTDCQDQLFKVKNIFLEFHGKTNELTKLISLLTVIKNNNFNYYIKVAADSLQKPFINKMTPYRYDIQLNIFCFR